MFPTFSSSAFQFGHVPSLSSLTLRASMQILKFVYSILKDSLMGLHTKQLNTQQLKLFLLNRGNKSASWNNKLNQDIPFRNPSTSLKINKIWPKSIKFVPLPVKFSNLIFKSLLPPNVNHWVQDRMEHIHAKFQVCCWI